MKAIDISIYTGDVSPAQAGQWAASGIQHAVIAYDTTALSGTQKRSVVGAGMTWDPYRYLYMDRPVQMQIDNVRNAIVNDPNPLPGYLWIDCEDDPPANNPSTWISQALTACLAYDIGGPNSLVKLGLYTGKWWWDKYMTGMTWPADNGMALWAAQWDGIQGPDAVTLFGGWTRAEGKQWGASITTLEAHPAMARWHIANPLAHDPYQAFLAPNVDGDTFRDRGVTPPPPPVNPLEARVAALEAWQARVRA